ncbi:MAG: DUF4358 domain-containing protein [Lachnospiraceae bacterium]|nr:DUF4358 domain-containing protein [Lachnospiraceae bacterium]
MKRLSCFILAFLLLVSLAGCSRQQASETDKTLEDIAAAIQKDQQGLPDLMRLTPEDTYFTTWLCDYYLLQAEQVSDGIICYADGAEASEIAVLLLSDEKECKAAEEALNEYIQNRVHAFEGYAPYQAAMVKEGMVVRNGRYITLLICPEPKLAKEVFLHCFGKSAESSGKKTENETNIEENAAAALSQETEERAETDRMEDSYNAEAILAAFRSGDDSSLSEINRSILAAAKAVIAEEITDDMSDYEKELAIHDYITGWSRFDYGVFGRSSADGFTDGSDTPYGVLIDQSAMCHGYSSTFQLFMDILGIECITVFGIPGGNGVEHSWNMVKLDGAWYCVDCAWDDPIGGSPCHTYFNVTSEYLRRGSIHRWDEASVPEAVGTVYAYGND